MDNNTTPHEQQAKHLYSAFKATGIPESYVKDVALVAVDEIMSEMYDANAHADIVCHTGITREKHWQSVKQHIQQL